MPADIDADFDKFHIIRPLGSGGFADVYLARQEGLSRLVALKVLKPMLSGDPGLVRRLELEADKASELKHPNIVTIHGIGKYDGRPYIVMEYVEGQSLEALLAAGRPAPGRALHILEQIAAALDYAHSRGLAHRDIKPANILVGPDEVTGDAERAKLVDFGLVRASEASVVTSLNQALGSPAYMAPEQLDTERAGEIGSASDIYAFGIVAYEALAGQKPFAGSTTAVAVAQLTRDPRPLHEVNPDAPAAAWEALAPALAKTVEARPSSAVALVAALKAAYAPAPLPAANALQSGGERHPLTPVQSGGEKHPLTPVQSGGERHPERSAAESKDASRPPTPAPRAASDAQRSPARWLPYAALVVAALILALALILPRLGANRAALQQIVTPTPTATPTAPAPASAPLAAAEPAPPPTARVIKETVVVEKTVLVEKPVEKTVESTVVVEKPVQQTVVVEKSVEKTVIVPVFVTPEPTRRPVFFDDFDKARHWKAYSDKFGNAKYADGGYVLLAKSSVSVWHDVLPGRTFGEGVIEVDATPLTAENTGVGISLGWKSGNTEMIFGILPGGECALVSYQKSEYDESNSYAWLGCPEIVAGRTYRLRVEVAGTNVRGYVDGQWVAEADVPTYTAGGAGVAVFNWRRVVLSDVEPDTSARFDNFGIWK